MAVDATLPQPGDAHDLGHRGAAIALSVEEARRLGHDPPPSCLALFHLPLKKETGRSLVYKLPEQLARCKPHRRAHPQYAGSRTHWRRTGTTAATRATPNP